VSRLKNVTAFNHRLYGLTNARKTDEPFQFDTDSYIIAIDNCSTSSMTCDINDYIKPPMKVNLRIWGLNGNVNTTYKGTVKWKFADNKGMVHDFILDNVYYCDTLPFKLLSPQHWAQAHQRQDRSAVTTCLTDASHVHLIWSNKCGPKYIKTVPLDTSSNIATFRSSPGYKTFISCFPLVHSTPIPQQELPVVSDDESDVASPSSSAPIVPEKRLCGSARGSTVARECSSRSTIGFL